VNATLTTVAGRRILSALASFGAYIVDDAAGAYMGRHGKTNINYEQGVAEELFENEGLVLSCSPKTNGGRLFHDLAAIFRALEAIENNSPANRGGGGDPIVPPPPALCPLVK